MPFDVLSISSSRVATGCCVALSIQLKREILRNHHTVCQLDHHIHLVVMHMLQVQHLRIHAEFRLCFDCWAVGKMKNWFTSNSILKFRELIVGHVNSRGKNM